MGNFKYKISDRVSAFVDWQKRNAQFRRDRDWSRSADHSNIGALNFPTIGGRRCVGTIDWKYRAFGGSFTTNYVGPNDAFYQTNAINKTRPTTWLDLGPWQTYDVQAYYDLPWLKTTRVTVGAINVTNRPPPFYDGAAEGYDPAVANPYGGMYYVKLTKKF